MDRICSSLTNAGHEVVLVGRQQADSLPLLNKPYQQVRLPLHFQRGKLFYLEYNWRLWRWLNKQSYDVVNSVDLDTLLPGYLASQRGKKLVFDAHEYFSETPEVVDRPLVRNIWRRLAQWLIPKADLCYTVGPALANIFRRQYGVDFGIVRNLPTRSLTTSPTTNLTDQPIILYQGMLNRGRGLEAAIEAMRELPQCKLWLVGKGDVENDLRRCSADLQQQGRVVFKGFLTGKELLATTRQATIGLNLLDAVSPSYYYSLANKTFDYLQAGLPSVQMNFPEYRALQERYKCFLMLPELNASKLAKLLRNTLEHPAVYQQLQSACLRAREDLVWEREEKRLLALWASIG